MKRFLLIVLAAGLLFSCQKKENETTPQFQDVSFKALEITPDAGLKSTADWECKDIIPTNAWLVINGEDYFPELFEVNGDLFTKALKLPVLENNAPYCISAFILYYEGNDTPGYQAAPVGDEIVYGTPLPGSDYETYINEGYRFPYCFIVDAFAKAEIPIEVLCYQDAVYNEFGFNWFAITEIVIREQCFFGDFCITNPADYAGSIYDDATNGVQVDEEANIKVIVTRNGVEVPNSAFDNTSIYGSGSPLCVQYPDYLGQTDDFTFEIQLWQATSNGGFYWQTYATFYSQDDGDLYDNNGYTGTSVVGDDGVVDFAVGSCSPDSYPFFMYINPPAIGDFIDGGVVFYIAQTPTDLDGDGILDKGLVCAISSQDDGYGATWYNGVFITTGATGTAIGTGHSNTATIISVQGAGTYGATLCAAYGDGNWFLPSKDELNEIDLNRIAIDATATANGGIALPPGLHLSSSESDETHAWYDLNGNPPDTFQKDLKRYVRAVRAF